MEACLRFTPSGTCATQLKELLANLDTDYDMKIRLALIR